MIFLVLQKGGCGMAQTQNPTPLAVWDGDWSAHKDLVWWTRLDNRYQIEVHRTAEYKGLLCIFDHKNADELLHTKEVGLAFNAIFGPDVSDTEQWQDHVVSFVDKELP